MIILNKKIVCLLEMIINFGDKIWNRMSLGKFCPLILMIKIIYLLYLTIILDRKDQRLLIQGMLKMV